MEKLVMVNLVETSIIIIQKFQSESGAYVASPNFPTYNYCWFRDGAFTAYAMDLYGQTESSRRFHLWASKVILDRKEMILIAIEKARKGLPITIQKQLHTRYTLEGEDGTKDEWPNFQLDGLGTWLWSLQQHKANSNLEIPEDCLEAAKLVADYLSVLWHQPCYDCWEEFPDDIHTHTLAAIYGGLNALSIMDGKDRSGTLKEIQKFVNEQLVYDGYFVKKIHSFTVDASLLGLVVPYGLVAIDDQRFDATLGRIENSLRKGGGLHRYPTDTYYGGGEWILLTAWLGWVYASRDDMEKAGELLSWIEKQADTNGNLPEQIPATLNDPNYYQPWLRQWGEIAKPLLWSHAQYLILKKQFQN
jgi:GH15 family glucan-1,4-alpha-glucosidase